MKAIPEYGERAAIYPFIQPFPQFIPKARLFIQRSMDLRCQLANLLKMKSIAILVLLPLAVACSKDPDSTPQTPPNDKAEHKLKEIIWHGLPAPHYQFTYDAAGFITTASYSSGVRSYNLAYANERISTLQSTRTMNTDKLEYVYASGKVAMVKYLNDQGQIFRRCYLEYNALGQLIKMEFERREPNAGFLFDRVFTFSYYPDGNLKEKEDHWLPVPNQPEARQVDLFEDYDNKKNTDAFMLLHPSQEHFFLLPGIVIQKNNARKLTRSGTGINYVIDYTYQYNSDQTINKKIGDARITSGPDNGKTFSIGIDFTYYE